MVTRNANKLNKNHTLLTATPHSYQLCKQHCASKKYTTEPLTITLTVVV